MPQDDARDPLPPFHDDLDAAFAEAWRLLADGVAQGRSAFHAPSFATLDQAGRPRSRTVVLREADAATGTLRFHCDRRSDKAAEVAANPACALHAYDRAAKIQIRIEGSAGLHVDDAVADAAWDGSRAMSRVCYGIAPAPGTALDAGGGYAVPDEAAALTVGRPNFAAVLVRADALDFLYLDRRGHRRAGWRRDGEGWRGEWRVP
jgi:hypothetical protein